MESLGFLHRITSSAYNFTPSFPIRTDTAEAGRFSLSQMNMILVEILTHSSYHMGKFPSLPPSSLHIFTIRVLYFVKCFSYINGDDGGFFLYFVSIIFLC